MNIGKVSINNPCPKCGGDLKLIIETESRGKGLTSLVSYVCSACGYREVTDEIVMRRDGDKLLLSRVKIRANSKQAS